MIAGVRPVFLRPAARTTVQDMLVACRSGSVVGCWRGLTPSRGRWANWSSPDSGGGSGRVRRGRGSGPQARARGVEAEPLAPTDARCRLKVLSADVPPSAVLVPRFVRTLPTSGAFEQPGAGRLRARLLVRVSRPATLPEQ
ncbi:hypothetical protein QJS66_21795 [Kocuria rhizophila]|nr:hypothetical protein QJS66_21795 [Kocuria rhizophila]